MSELVDRSGISFNAACKASKRGETEKVEEWLVQQQLQGGENSVDQRSQVKGSTLTSWACFGGQLATVTWLLEEKGADKTQRENNGWTLLHNACCSGNGDLVKYLVETHRLDLTLKGNNDETALQVAVKKGKAGPAVYLLEQDGVEINWEVSKSEAFKAAGAGILEVVKAWLQQGGNVNMFWGRNGTLLHCACKKGQVEIARFLLQEAGASLELRDHRFGEGRTPFCTAVAGNHIELVEWLKQETNCKVDFETACAAAENGHLQFIQEYVENGGDVNREVENSAMGMTLLHCAAITNQLETVKWLVISGGANVDPRVLDESRPPALSYACEFDAWEVAEWMATEGGASFIEYEAAHSAVIRGSLTIVKAYMQKQIDKGIDDSYQQNANKLLKLAIENSKEEIAFWLRSEAGAGYEPDSAVNSTDKVITDSNNIYGDLSSDKEEESEEDKEDSCDSNESSNDEDDEEFDSDSGY